MAQTGTRNWRGFNLLEMFSASSKGNFMEDDFRWIADWGFSFVRLPANYLLWTDKKDIFKMREDVLMKLDRAIDLASRYGLHVSLNLHTAPGYCVAAGWKDPFGIHLWKDPKAAEAFCFHWEMFSRRYKGISSDKLSFNLVNEPPYPSEEIMTRADHERVIRAATAAIRAIDPLRLIVVDGISYGNDCSPELSDLNVMQSCRAYLPMPISHFGASWVSLENSGLKPVWPGLFWENEVWDRRRLEEHYKPWIEMAKNGVAVHCGEGGAFSKTPHAIMLKWLRDILEILSSAKIGWALWNFRGSFGILDSGRADVKYADWQGHKLDQKLLKMLQEF